MLFLGDEDSTIVKGDPVSVMSKPMSRAPMYRVFAPSSYRTKISVLISIFSICATVGYCVIAARFPTKYGTWASSIVWFGFQIVLSLMVASLVNAMIVLIIRAGLVDITKEPSFIVISLSKNVSLIVFTVMVGLIFVFIRVSDIFNNLMLCLNDLAWRTFLHRYSSIGIGGSNAANSSPSSGSTSSMAPDGASPDVVGAAGAVVDPASLRSTTMATIASFIVGFAGCFMLINLLITIFTDYIAYKMHKDNFEKRVDAINEKSRILMKLVSLFSFHNCTDLTDMTNSLFKKIAGNSDVISADILSKFFKWADVEDIFDAFGVDIHDHITNDEFTSLYISLYNDRINFGRTLISCNECLERIKIAALLVLDVPVSALFSAWVGSMHGVVWSYVGPIVTLPITLGFVFGGIITNTIMNVMFIFFIRPFDTGDTIIIDGVSYKVYDIGLYYTMLENDSRIVAVNNSVISSKFITNSTRSYHRTVTYELKADATSFDSPKFDTFKSKVSEYIGKNGRYFRRYHEVICTNIQSNVVAFTVSTCMAVPYDDERTFGLRKSALTLFLMNAVKEAGITLR